MVTAVEATERGSPAQTKNENDRNRWLHNSMVSLEVVRQTTVRRGGLHRERPAWTPTRGPLSRTHMTSLEVAAGYALRSELRLQSDMTTARWAIRWD